MLIEQVQNNLLIANGLDEKFLNKQVHKIINKQVDYCDLYLQNSTHEAFTLDEGIIKSASFAGTQGIGVRAICYDKTFLSYANDLHPVTIKALVNNLFIEPAVDKTYPQLQQMYLDQDCNKAKAHVLKQAKALYQPINPIECTNISNKIAMLNTLDQLGRKQQFVENVIVNLSLEYDEICIVNSESPISSDIRPLIHLSVTIVINKGGKLEKGYSGCGGRYAFDELAKPEILQQQINVAYQQALLKLDAIAAPSGQMPVILGNGWAGVILHEAVGHGLEGDFNRKGISAFSNKIGQQVASKLVTVIDEGCIDNRRGSLTIDDEGTATQRTVLIENGILRAYMFDKLNAKLMGCKSTGNGRRESFCCSPMPRMTNTYMLSGTNTAEEVLASVKYGLYAENFEGGQVDITSGQFVFNANVAWVIKNGKLAYPVKGCALVGSGPECLKHVTMVANNSTLDAGIGVCGKEGQTVPVGVGQPTIRIDGGLVVGGEN